MRALCQVLRIFHESIPHREEHFWGGEGKGQSPGKVGKSKAQSGTPDQPLSSCLVHPGTGTAQGCSCPPHSAAPRAGRLQEAPPMEELLLLPIAVGLSAGNCISPRVCADTAVGEQFLCIRGQRTMWAKLLKWRARLCFEKQKISPLGLGSPLN